uniref:Uncharacterized protein n=1 Tax=Parascaris univalens TaxID=6257 RepID=A0A915CJA2_PARUN
FRFSGGRSNPLWTLSSRIFPPIEAPVVVADVLPPSPSFIRSYLFAQPKRLFSFTVSDRSIGANAINSQLTS